MSVSKFKPSHRGEVTFQDAYMQFLVKAKLKPKLNTVILPLYMRKQIQNLRLHGCIGKSWHG